MGSPRQFQFVSEPGACRQAYQPIHAESADLASLQIRYSRLRNSQHLYLPIRLRPAQRLVAVTTNSVDVTSRMSARNLKSLALPKAASNPA